jgi:hypothetical protein
MARPQPGEALDDGSELYERKGNLTALARGPPTSGDLG